ncbi:MAG: TVP38/TMEM64 family protein [Negativibacillus massiliensis]|uniref:TVP38/TMEM64 family protein n=1 Tax=Negativibacillus massiliensis TaxID=1871035 RepID=UPI00399B3A8A
MKKIKLIVFILLVAVILILDHRFGWSGYLGNLDNLTFLKEMVQQNLWQAMLIYLVVTVVGCVVLALPGATFALFAGILFGPWLGILNCLVATTLGASAAFLTGRFFLKDSIKPIAQKNRYLKKLLFDSNPKSELVVLMITRLVPLFPYNLQNFAYGITDISFWKYTIYTFVFMFPGVSFFTIGAAGLTATKGRVWYFVAAGVLCLLVMGAGYLLKKRYLSEEMPKEISREMSKEMSRDMEEKQ